MSREAGEVIAMLDELGARGHGEDRVSLGDVVETFGHRGTGAFLMVPALIELSPIGGIPGVPTVLALIVGLFAVQIVWGRDCLWLPDFLERRTVSGERFEGAMRRMRPVARWMDRWFHGRFPTLTRPSVRRAAAALCVILCLTVPPLEVIPFASSAPMGAIALLGLAMLVNDGALMLVGLIAGTTALGAGIWMLLGQ
jgi:hypothetical protein